MSSFEIETLKALPPCHPQLVEAIITQIKSQGLFDEFRKSCLSDIDTKPSYLNLKQRVEGYVNNFLSRQKWSNSLQKNQLRELLRKDINESGLLKTGLDHLVDQLLYAQAENSIRPKVRAEIKKFLHLSEAPSSVAVCVPNYPIAPPNYGPPALPPLPPVPPPPDVTGAMIDSFGGLKPPEPPSPHGSEYSVDMSDSSMVGRDEAPPAIPSRTVRKPDMVESEEISSSPMELEVNAEEDQVSKRDDESQNQALARCSSPEIFEEVSEGGSLGDTPLRDEEVLNSENESDQARTDFTGLFQDSRALADRQCNGPEVIMEDEDMVYEVPEECVKVEETVKNEDEGATSSINEEVVPQEANLAQGNVTPIMDEILEDDNMQISSDEETQCANEVLTLNKKSDVLDRVECPPALGAQLTIVEKALEGTLDAELSDTQPPLEIDTDDSQVTVTEKTQVEFSQGNEGTTETRQDTGMSYDVQCTAENNQLFNTNETPDDLLGVWKGLVQENKEKPDLRKSDSSSNRSVGVATEKSKTGGTYAQKESVTLQGKNFKHRDRKASSQKSSSRSEIDRDRHREHRLSSLNHHVSSSSSSSSKARKVEDYDQKSRDKDYREKRDDRRDRDRDRKKDRDSKDRDRRQRDSKHRSSLSHSSKKHSRHHQERRRDDERKTHCSVSSSLTKFSRTKANEPSELATAELANEAIDHGHEDHFEKSQQTLSDHTEITAHSMTSLPGESVSHLSPPATDEARVATTKAPYEDDNDSELELGLKKSKRKSLKEKVIGENSIQSEMKDTRNSKTRKSKRRSSAASVSSQQSAEALDQPESPVPSKFGRQRKINPKYEDDGTLSALLFGKN